MLAVGGTNLFLNGNSYGSEDGWSGSGGSVSTFESKPGWQTGSPDPTHRSGPDVAFNGGEGVAIYDTYNNSASTPWVGVHGTSFSAPSWAGLIAIANQGRTRAGLGNLDGVSQTLPKIYQLPTGDFHDITSGNNGNQAGPGYDLVTGRGTPIANLLVPDLVNTTLSIDSLSVDPDPATVGDTLNLTANSVAGPVTSVSFYNDTGGGHTLISTDTDGSDGFTANFDTTGLSTGTLTFSAQATDGLGHTSTLVSQSSQLQAAHTAAPGNNDFANAYYLYTDVQPGSETGSDFGYNTNATKETGEPNHAGNTGVLQYGGLGPHSSQAL